MFYLAISVFITLCFDAIRDKYCCVSPINNDMLDTNWKVLTLSYCYAVFYGIVFGMISPLFVDIENDLIYFLIITFVQRFMCFYVMPNIHVKTSPEVHFGYYLLYFVGSMLPLVNISNTYILMSILSASSSLVMTYLRGNQCKYMWNIQYKNGEQVRVTLTNRGYPFYQQMYTRFEYYHLRVVSVLLVILFFIL